MNDGIRVLENEGWNNGYREGRMDLGSRRMRTRIMVYKVDDKNKCLE